MFHEEFDLVTIKGGDSVKASALLYFLVFMSTKCYFMFHVISALTELNTEIHSLHSYKNQVVIPSNVYTTKSNPTRLKRQRGLEQLQLLDCLPIHNPTTHSIAV